MPGSPCWRRHGMAAAAAAGGLTVSSRLRRAAGQRKDGGERNGSVAKPGSWKGPAPLKEAKLA